MGLYSYLNKSSLNQPAADSSNFKASMVSALKVMILEDQKVDQALVKRQVLKYEPQSVFLIAENKNTFLEKIDWFLPDLLLADYNLSDYTGLDALMYVKENKPFIPFIFVTGGLHQIDPVAEVVLKLADGFVMKDNLSTLHIELESIMKQMKYKILNQNELSRKLNEKRIKILKATALLKESGDFSKKEELIKLLREIDGV